MAKLIPDVASSPDFLRALFCALDEREVRYCVLHTWKDLPEVLCSDLDIAVHPDDRPKLPAVFETLRAVGVLPVQCRNYAVQGYAFFFLWFCGPKLKSAQLDVIFEYCPSSLASIPGKMLICGRRRRKSIWIANPLIAFRYLLIKKTIKGEISPCQQEQLRGLVAQVGRPAAEMVSADLFGEQWKALVVKACSEGTLAPLIKQLGGRLKRTSIVRNPAGFLSYFIRNSARLVRRWFQPTGFCLVLFGPDGVGKSSLGARLVDELRPVFDRQRTFHFRPQFIVPRKDNSPSSSDPHSAKPRGTAGSVAQLLGFFVDCWIGYLLVVRPLLCRSGLAVFDRSFHDLMIDRDRYRYGGPSWLPRLLARFVPPSDAMFLVLDADVTAILSRKREVAPVELQRLRSLYIDFASETSRAALIKTDEGIEQSVAASLRAISQCLMRYFDESNRAWVASSDAIKHETKAEEIPQL